MEPLDIALNQLVVAGWQRGLLITDDDTKNLTRCFCFKVEVNGNEVEIFTTFDPNTDIKRLVALFMLARAISHTLYTYLKNLVCTENMYSFWVRGQEQPLVFCKSNKLAGIPQESLIKVSDVLFDILIDSVYPFI